MASSSREVAQYIARHPVFSPYVPRPGYPRGIWRHQNRRALPSVEQLPEAMVEDVGLQALQLGQFLSTPDGELIADGVRLALPAADAEIFSLAVDALTLAATKRSAAARKEVGAAALVIAACIWLLSRS